MTSFSFLLPFTFFLLSCHSQNYIVQRISGDSNDESILQPLLMDKCQHLSLIPYNGEILFGSQGVSSSYFEWNYWKFSCINADTVAAQSFPIAQELLVGYANTSVRPLPDFPSICQDGKVNLTEANYTIARTVPFMSGLENDFVCNSTENNSISITYKYPQAVLDTSSIGGGSIEFIFQGTNDINCENVPDGQNTTVSNEYATGICHKRLGNSTDLTYTMWECDASNTGVRRTYNSSDCDESSIIANETLTFDELYQCVYEEFIREQVNLFSADLYSTMTNCKSGTTTPSVSPTMQTYNPSSSTSNPTMTSSNPTSLTADPTQTTNLPTSSPSMSTTMNPTSLTSNPTMATSNPTTGPVEDDEDPNSMAPLNGRNLLVCIGLGIILALLSS